MLLLLEAFKVYGAGENAKEMYTVWFNPANVFVLFLAVYFLLCFFYGILVTKTALSEENEHKCLLKRCFRLEAKCFNIAY